MGPVAAATVRRYHADLAVIGAAGLSARHGITELNDEAAEIQRLIMEHSRRLVVVADGSKVGQIAMASVAPARRIAMLITDDTAPTRNSSSSRRSAWRSFRFRTPERVRRTPEPETPGRPTGL